MGTGEIVCDFQVVAQAKRFFDIITGREVIYTPSTASDFGFDKVKEVKNIEDVDQSKASKDPTIVDSKITKPDQAASAVKVPIVKKPKADHRGKFSLSPYKISKIQDKASSSQEQDGNDKGKSPEVATTSTHKKLNLSSQLALYKFNLDAYKKSQKCVYQAMALLVYWVNPVICGQL